MNRDEVLKQAILRVQTGSHAYGLNVAGSDVDEKAVVIEPMAEVAGIGEPWGGKVYSQSGEQDFEVYGLRKFLRLAMKGNPTVTEIMFIKPVAGDARGQQLQQLYPLIVSKAAGAAYLGYMHAQRLRMLGQRGNGGHGEPRKDLVREFGFDTKFAMHMLRLGLQGMELLRTGGLTLPINGEDRDFLLSVRRGEVTEQRCLSLAEHFEAELKDLIKTSTVQAEPQREEIEKWMLRMYFYTWSALRSPEDLAERQRIYELLRPSDAAQAASVLFGNSGASKAPDGDPSAPSAAPTPGPKDTSPDTTSATQQGR